MYSDNSSFVLIKKYVELIFVDVVMGLILMHKECVLLSVTCDCVLIRWCFTGVFLSYVFRTLDLIVYNCIISNIINYYKETIFHFDTGQIKKNTSHIKYSFVYRLVSPFYLNGLAHLNTIVT